MNTKTAISLILLAAALAISACSTPRAKPAFREQQFIIAVHSVVYTEEQGQLLLQGIPGLAAKGINTLFVDVGWFYEWSSHPELRTEGSLTFSTAQSIADVCAANGLRVIPEIPCIGHQSWEQHTGPFLTAYPQFDETPGLYPGNKGISLRSWCTSNPDIYPIVFDLIDEITMAFGAKAIHIGCDEIFLIGEQACPRCHDKDKGELLANAIKRLHEHIVLDRGFKMYMWGDRLINGEDPNTNYYGAWESSQNGTWSAVDLIPKDIIICDWHYDPQKNYGSIPYFLDKGFRILTASYSNIEAAKTFIDQTLKYKKNPLVLGHIYCSWGSCENDRLDTWLPLVRTVSLLTKPR